MYGLYAITHEPLMAGEQLQTKVRAVLEGGCRYVQYRNKSSDWTQKRREAEALKILCEDYGALLIINDSIELAIEVEAAGVHLGQDDESVASARGRLEPGTLVGATCHASLALAQAAAAAGADYVAFGRFFNSRTKPQAPPASLALLEQVRENLHLPAVAIGGINRHNVADIIAAGAHAVAVSHDLFAPSEPAEITARAKFYQSLFNGH